MRKGQAAALRPLYQRHYAAVHAYASSCTPAPMDAHELTCRAFAQLLQRLLAGEFFAERRHPGCVRRQLHDMVRAGAVARVASDPDSLSAGFRAWVAHGSSWPMEEDGQLALAFSFLPAPSQCLLWHTVVEQDDAADVSRITGIELEDLSTVRSQAMVLLRQARAGLYLDRLGMQQCSDILRALAADPEAELDAAGADHLRVCAGCQGVYRDLAQLDSRLDAQLPGHLLGWWPGQAYLRAKESTSTPLADPPFLAQAVQRAESAMGSPQPAKPFVSRPSGRRRAPGRFRLPPAPTAATVLGLLLSGVAAFSLVRSGADDDASPSRPDPSSPVVVSPSPDPSSKPEPSPSPTVPPALSARAGVAATAYSYAQGTVLEGAAPGSLRLSSSSKLRFDHVDFSDRAAASAVFRLAAGTSSYSGMILMRLDSPDATPFAWVSAPSTSTAEDVSTAVIPVRGVHTVYITTSCPDEEPCLEFHEFSVVDDEADKDNKDDKGDEAPDSPGGEDQSPTTTIVDAVRRSGR
ncbi:carbohydrate-binding protein [Streptomyces sp. NPDC051907]|uniref:carbohydrate-binding protein n=1 Tax=Streptomyces sp. NPDC051907 TaxID=3155284 RepID=UPI00343B5CA9